MKFLYASIENVRELADMNRRLIQDEGHRNSMSPPELELRMAKWIGEGEYSAVLFIESEHTVGYALFQKRPEHVYLRQFFIEQQYRRRGFGRAAIHWMHKNVWGNCRVRV